jgi:thiamine-monophosphate kinase
MGLDALRGEFAFIDWLRRQNQPPGEHVLVGPGDDTAVLRCPTDSFLITTDMLLEGSCFRLAEAGPRRIGRKALAVNLSDLAAMAARPFAAVVSVGLPRTVPAPWSVREVAEELYLGIREMADSFACAIVGGDTSSWDGPLVINITAVGEPTGTGPVLRSRARVGDRLVVTGPLGGSIQGKHLDFTPRVTEALQLHALVTLHAMIDISDGLAADVAHLCRESRCGAVLWSEAIPITPEAQHAQEASPQAGAPPASRGRSPLEHALGDGEDFELVFSLAPEEAHRLVATQPIPGLTLTIIGECVDAGLWLEENGRRAPLDPVGYVHNL